MSGDTQKRQKIFIVDDSRVNMEVARRILKDKYEVSCMLSSKKLFEMLHYIKALPDLILLDIDMPCPNGITTLKTLKSDVRHNKYKDIPVAMLTANAQIETVRECIADGAAGYIIKPFDAETLLGHIEELLKTDGGEDEFDTDGFDMENFDMDNIEW